MALVKAAVKFWALVGIVGLLLGGCSFNFDQITRELAKSDRSWCVQVSSIYGTLRASGTGINAGSVLCNQEGMVVKAKGD